MEYNWTVIKSVILGIVFIAVAAFTFTTMDLHAQEEMVTTFKASTMPIVYMVSENNRLINPSHGYTQDVGEGNVFNGITPIYEDRNIDIAIYNYGERITGISYQVRDIDSNRLLEDTQLKLQFEQEDYTLATLNIKNLIEKDREYFLTIFVSTDRHEQIRYYQRIIWTDNLNIKDKLDFVLSFNSYTYSREKLDEIAKWIETDETGDNTNFGFVNIKSTKKQIGWGDLSARVEGNVIPTIWEITPTSAQISLSYRVVTTGTTTDYDAYSVKDYYRIRQTADTIYLMDYERKADQIFDAYNDLQSNGRINLGIKSELTDIESKADKSGKYSYFVQNGNLWCYNRNLNCFTNVFSFTSSSDYNGRPDIDEHSIKIIDVDSEGNVWFSVCGYMNGGEHTGQTGLSLFYYNYEEGIVKEYVYVPVNVPYQMIKDNVGDVSYISEYKYYVKINQYLYSIDLTSGEYMMITDRLYDGTYAVNESGDRIAYHENHTLEDCKAIRIYDFEQDEEMIINGASYGGGRSSDYLKIIGYIGDDLVYGMANPLDFEGKNKLNRIFPMYSLVVINDEETLIKKYSQEGVYISSAEIDGMRVNLYRVVKNEEGQYESTSIDQLLNKEENTASSGIYTEIVATSAREKELYLNIPTSSGDLENVSVKFSKEIQFMEQSLYSFESNYVFTNEYIVYSKGEWAGNYDNIRKAIGIASGGYGYVVGPSGNYVWKKTEGNIPAVCNEENVPADVLTNYEYNLSGVSLDNILYYVSIGRIVAAKLGEDKFVYIYDYDKNDIIYYDAELNKAVTLDRDTAGKLFIRYDNIFLLPKQ